jgi:hypothetical protein
MRAIRTFLGEQQDLPARGGESRGRHKPGEPAADDDHVRVNPLRGEGFAHA